MMLGLGLALTQARGGGGGGASTKMPVGTHLIVVGPSIQNVTNMRAPRHWLSVGLLGRLYTTPGTNQSVGGACATVEGATASGNATNYWGARQDWTLKQIPTVASGKSALVLWDDFINDLGKAGVTLAKLTAEVDRRIAMLATYPNLWMAFACIIDGDATATDPVKEAVRTGFNNYLIALKGTHPRLIICDTRLTTYDRTESYDGLHPRGYGAFDIGFLGDAVDISPFIDTGTILYGASAGPNNLETDWNFSGTGGTAGLGTSGQVATGWSVFCSTTGTAGGATAGLTASCSKGTDDQGFPAQIIELSGTPSADGFLIPINTVSFTNDAGQFANAWSRVALTGYGQANPAGIASIGAQLGVLGANMAKNVEANAGYFDRSFVGVVRTVPLCGLINNASSQGWEPFSIGFKSGVPINLRLVISQGGVERCETVAYAAPFNLSSAYPGSSQNPISATRPAITGTKQVGQTGTLQIASYSGGGITWTAFEVVDASNAVQATRTPGGAAMTYVWQAGDAGKTERLRQTGSNTEGAANFDDGVGYLIAA